MKRLASRSATILLLILLPAFGCISDSEPDLASDENVATSSEYSSKFGELQQGDLPRPAPTRVWETAAGEMDFNSRELFSAMINQKRELTDNSRLERKTATTDKVKKNDSK